MDESTVRDAEWKEFQETMEHPWDQNDYWVDWSGVTLVPWQTVGCFPHTESEQTSQKQKHKQKQTSRYWTGPSKHTIVCVCDFVNIQAVAQS